MRKKRMATKKQIELQKEKQFLQHNRYIVRSGVGCLLLSIPLAVAAWLLPYFVQKPKGAETLTVEVWDSKVMSPKDFAPALLSAGIGVGLIWYKLRREKNRCR